MFDLDCFRYLPLTRKCTIELNPGIIRAHRFPVNDRVEDDPLRRVPFAFGSKHPLFNLNQWLFALEHKPALTDNNSCVAIPGTVRAIRSRHERKMLLQPGSPLRAIVSITSQKRSNSERVV